MQQNGSTFLSAVGQGMPYLLQSTVRYSYTLIADTIQLSLRCSNAGVHNVAIKTFLLLEFYGRGAKEVKFSSKIFQSKCHISEFHRDVVGEFSLAMRKSYLHLGLYHSFYEWFNPLFKEDVDNLFQTNFFPTTKVSKYI